MSVSRQAITPFPLNNPLPPVVVVRDINVRTMTADRDRGVSKGGKGKGRLIAVEAIVHCQMCGHHSKIVFGFLTPPSWHRCPWCSELQPTDGYRVEMYGTDLPRVKTPLDA